MTCLAVDLGSSSCKAALLREGCFVSRVVRRPHNLLAGGGPEPETALAVVEGSVRELLAQELPTGGPSSTSPDALVLSSFMAFCFLDRGGSRVAPCAAYSDRSAAAAVEGLTEVAGGLESFVAITGRRPAAELAAAHLVSLRDRDPDSFNRLSRLSSLKDLLLEALTGRRGMDLVHANYTGLLEVNHTRPWAELLRELRLPEDLVGALQEPGEFAGSLTGEAARRLGLPAGLPVVRGSIDGTTAMYGAGVLFPRTATLVCGTTDVIMSRSERGPGKSTGDGPGVSIPGLTTNSALGGGYLTGGSTALSGGLIGYLEELFGVKATLIEGETGEVGPGAGGLRVLPGIAGERAPFWLPEAAGAVRGWRREHRREHFFRAAMEATAFRVARIAREMMSAGASFSTVRLAGGGSGSPLWNTIRAAALAAEGVQETVAASAGEATLIGSAIFCDIALCGADPLESTRRWAPAAATVEPLGGEDQAALAREYDELFNELEEGA